MERILYTKYSNERTAQFAIRTDIVEKDGSRQVRKKAYYEAGKPHIRKIYEAYEQLSCSFFVYQTVDKPMQMGRRWNLFGIS